MNINVLVKEIKPVSSPEEGFRLYKELSNGGRIEIMNGYVTRSDHKDLLSISRYLAMQGKKVQITTDVHFKDEKYKLVFGKLTGTIYERKCPDLIIDGEFYEYESYKPPFKKGKVSNMIGKGTRQSSRIIIDNNKGCSDRYIRRNILERIADKNFNYEIEEVWLYEKGNIRLLFKKQ